MYFITLSDAACRDPGNLDDWDFATLEEPPDHLDDMYADSGPEEG